MADDLVERLKWRLNNPSDMTSAFDGKYYIRDDLAKAISEIERLGKHNGDLRKLLLDICVATSDPERFDELMTYYEAFNND